MKVPFSGMVEHSGPYLYKPTYQHDEIIVEAREDIGIQVQKIVIESMEEAFKKIIPEVPFVVEPRVADSWKSWDLKHSSLLLRESHIP